VEAPTWTDNAACRLEDIPTEWFFPERGTRSVETVAALECCDRCEVREDCLAYALASNERYGIYGGLSESERRRVKRQLAARGIVYRFKTCGWCGERFGIAAGVDSRKYCPPPSPCAAAAEAERQARRDRSA
jgi:hypothetical protein